MPADSAVLVARIGKPHGLHGEVTVQLHTDEPERRLAVGAVLDTEAAHGTGVPRALTVRSTRVHRGIWLVGFEEVPDRTGAESLRGTRLVVEPGEEPEPEPEPDVEPPAEQPAGAPIRSAGVAAFMGSNPGWTTKSAIPDEWLSRCSIVTTSHPAGQVST